MMNNTERKFHWCLEKGIDSPKYIAMIRRTDEFMGSDAKALREEFQYGTEIEVEDEILENMQNNAKEFVEASRIILEEIKV